MSSRSTGVVELEGDAGADLVALERAVLVERDLDTQPRRRGERESRPEREQERRGHRDELRASGDERGQQTDRRDACVRRELRGRVSGQARARSSAAGVGTVSSRSCTTSSADTRCTQSSGRKVSRCASAGTATDLTSSGVT